MNIAIPVFANRVSPRFDSADKCLLVRVSNGVVHERTEQPMRGVMGWRRAELLTKHSVDVLLCGGIRQCDYFAVADAGIDVYPGLMGEVNDILDAFFSGKISKDGFCGAFVPVQQRRRRRRAGRCSDDQRPGGRGPSGADARGLNGNDRRTRSS